METVSKMKYSRTDRLVLGNRLCHSWTVCSFNCCSAGLCCFSIFYGTTEKKKEKKKKKNTKQIKNHARSSVFQYTPVCIQCPVFDVKTQSLIIQYRRVHKRC